MISVICIYNDKKIFERWLLKSLKKQTVGFELIGIDNSKKFFNSAAEGLNYGAKQAKGEYLMFVHQDVFLREYKWMEKAEDFLSKISNLGMAGVAGKRKLRWGETPFLFLGIKRTCIGMLYHSFERKCWSFKFNKPIGVETLDEQALIIPRKIFNLLQFDGKTCKGWHLYGTDYALSIKKIGLKTFVLPLSVRHLSKGTFDKDYFETLHEIFKKHSDYLVINTTGGIFLRNRFLNYLISIIQKLRKYVINGRK